MSEIVVAEACRPLVLRMSLISYVLYGDSGRCISWLQPAGGSRRHEWAFIGVCNCVFVCPSARALKGIRVLELSTLRSVEVFSYAWRLNSASPVNVARILVRPRCLETLQRRNSDEYDCIGNCKIQHHKYFFLNRSVLYSENKALRFWKTECKCRITLVDIFAL